MLVYNDLIMSTGVVRSVVVMLVGVMFIFWSESVANLFIRFLGFAFFLPAFVSMVRVLLAGAQVGTLAKTLVSVVDVGSMAFGLWLIVAPAGFETMVVKFLAVVALLFAVFQVYMVFVSHRKFALSWWTLLLPLLMVVGSVLLLNSPLRPLRVLSVLFGVVVFLSGLFDLVLSLKNGRADRMHGGDAVLPE